MYKLETFFDNDKLPSLERELVCKEDFILCQPDEVFKMLNEKFRIGYRTEEFVYMISLDTKGKVIGVFEISHGIVNGSYANPREIFMKAQLCGASSIIVAHNHPSGDLSPSRQDMDCARRIKEAGKILGIPLSDFMICSITEYFSFNEKNLL